MVRVLACAATVAASATVVVASSDAVDLCGHREELCGIDSFSGFLNVSGAGSLFYWYFEGTGAAASDDAAEPPPLLLWLQGGPGSPSMLGALFEHGPVRLDEAGNLRRRSDSETWSSRWPILYIDSPVGTGWSFAESDLGYAKSQEDVAHTLSVVLEAFARLHPGAPRHLLLSGESYGGHYIPALGAYLLDHPGSFTLRGIAIGDGFTNPLEQVLTKPKEAFALGLLDERQLEEAEVFATAAHSLALAGDLVNAALKRYAMEDFVKNVSLINPYDVRTTEQYDWMDLRMAEFFGRDATKDLLHVPKEQSFGTNAKVKEHLLGDIMLSQHPNVEKLLEAGLPVLLYQGQFDWKDGVVSNEAWIRQLNWTGRAGYLAADRTVWRRAVDGQIAGYWRHYKTLHQVVVLGAGHLVPMNQPLSARDMLTRFLDFSPLAAPSKSFVLYT